MRVKFPRIAQKILPGGVFEHRVVDVDFFARSVVEHTVGESALVGKKQKIRVRFSENFVCILSDQAVAVRWADVAAGGIDL